ncbi:hypothetical protein FKM82_016162 [Ascaphus truei]
MSASMRQCPDGHYPSLINNLNSYRHSSIRVPFHHFICLLHHSAHSHTKLPSAMTSATFPPAPVTPLLRCQIQGNCSNHRHIKIC